MRRYKIQESEVRSQKSGVRILLFCSLLTAYCLLSVIPSLAEDKIAIDPNQPITITSNSMEARKKENLVIFKGDVKAEQKDYTLYSKELHVYYADGQQIKEMIATGDVKIVQANKMATGEKAVYTREDRTVVLTGNPQVEQDCDSVKGDKITIFLDEDKSLVEGSVKAVVNPKNGKTKAKCRQ